MQGHWNVDAPIFLEKGFVVVLTNVGNFTVAIMLLPFLVDDVPLIIHIITPMNDAFIFDCKLYQTKMFTLPSFK